MFEIGIVGQFEAAHRLPGNPGPASRLHGHTYRVEAVVRAERLRPDGTLCDVGILHDALDQILGELDYRCLDEVPAFAGRSTTGEVVAQELLRQLATRARQAGGESLRVVVWESPRVFAACESVLTE